MKRGESSIRSRNVAEETISFETTSFDSKSASPKTLWPSDDVYQRLMTSVSNDSTSSKSSSSSEAKDSSSSSLTYFQKLFLELSSSSSHEASSNIRISILSDNPATHSMSINGSKPQNVVPYLPPLDEYHPLDDFLPSLLEEKALMSMEIQAISVVSDNPSSFVPSLDSSSEQSSSLYSTTNEASEDAADATQRDSCHHSYSEQLPDEEKVLHCIAVPQVEELKTSDERFANYLSQMDESREHSPVGRSNSLDAIYSIPRPDCKLKRTLTRALSFEDGKKSPSKYNDGLGSIKKVFSKSPRSVLDLFNPEDTAELRFLPFVGMD